MAKRKTDLQLDLFDFSEDKYIIDKPVRLIELFAGIGFTRMGISRVFPDLESWRICEWGIPSILGYDAVHNGKYTKCIISDKDWLVDELYRLGISSNYDDPMKKSSIARLPLEKLQQIYSSIKRTNNLVNIMNVHGDDLGIVDTDKYCYIMTWSFPCQDLSLAGNKAGMETSQADGGTRSGLWHEVVRLLKECKEKPQVLIMENVIQIHSTENLDAFLRVQDELSKLGYANFWKDLNGVDYGVPQNRVRTFMVSILDKNAVYSFPEPEKLTKRLLDVLEDDVDPKYTISSTMVEYLTGVNQKPSKYDRAKVFERNLNPNKDVAATLTCRAGDRPTDNFILKKQLCDDLIADGKVQEGDIVKHSFTNQIMSGKKKCVEKSNEMITLTTRGDTVGVCVRRDPHDKD